MSDFFVNMVSSLSGASVGAGAAFLLESSRRRGVERQERIEATNVALHVLLEYYSELDAYNRNVLSPMQEKREEFLLSLIHI